MDILFETVSSVSPTHSVYCSFSIQSLRPIYRTSLQLTQELVRVEEKCTTYPRLVVENCEQIHGIVIVLLSQRAASREEKKKKNVRGHQFNLLLTLYFQEEVFTCQFWWWGHLCFCSISRQGVWSFSSLHGHLSSNWTALPWKLKMWIDYHII